ncbi:MAG: minor capsid protein [Peptoniphilus sp.]|nr:minor capsid protein [Peptoniphilus sp.]MDY3118192.1 minor capsid protein [Peptoniphilus sp.]
MGKTNKKNSFLTWAESTDRKIYRETDDYVKALRGLYDEAIDAMHGKIYKYLVQIAAEDGTSLAEAKRWLNGEERRSFQRSLEEFRRKSIDAIGNEALDKEVRQMSRRARISYLQATELSLKTEMAKLMNAEEKRLFNHLRKSYETKYYRELYGLARLVEPVPIQKVNGEAIQRVIGRHWHVDGKDLSDRLSERSKNTIALLEREIGQNLAMGKSQDEVIRAVAKGMNRSFRGAATLVQTETASILTQAARDSYNRYGVEEYELSATLDTKTSEICREMDRRHFPLQEMKQGINAPPFHPNCRTAIMPYFGDDLQKRMQAEVGRMARDPVTGKSVRVGDLSYKEWYTKYVEGSPQERGSVFVETSTAFRMSKTVRGQKVKELSKIEIDGQIYRKGEKHVVFDYSEEEKKIAQWLSDEIGGHVYLCPRITIPEGIRTPDYVWDAEKWDLKNINKHSKNTMTTAVKNTKNQSRNLILNLKDPSYADEDLYLEMERIFSNKRYQYIDKILVVEKDILRGIFKRK